jgi:hypothetical protein
LQIAAGLTQNIGQGSGDRLCADSQQMLRNSNNNGGHRFPDNWSIRLLISLSLRLVGRSLCKIGKMTH